MMLKAALYCLRHDHGPGERKMAITRRDLIKRGGVAVAGLAVPGVKVLGEECVVKSFPDFWERFQLLYD